MEEEGSESIVVYSLVLQTLPTNCDQGPGPPHVAQKKEEKENGGKNNSLPTNIEHVHLN